MIKILLLSCGLLGGMLYSQSIQVDTTFYHPFFDTQDSVLNPLTLYTNGDYDGTEDSLKYPVRSNCLVNRDPGRQIRFTACEQRNDTLWISLYETNPAYSHHLVLKINGDHVSADYLLDQSGPDLKRSIITKHCKLLLDRSATCGIINGYLEYEGECHHNCDAPVYRISGYFMLRPGK